MSFYSNLFELLIGRLLPVFGWQFDASCWFTAASCLALQFMHIFASFGCRSAILLANYFIYLFSFSSMLVFAVIMIVADFCRASLSTECKTNWLCRPDMELGQWVTGSMGHLGHLSRPSPGHHFYSVWDPSFSGFRNKCPKCKTYIWNAEMTKVIVRCLLLDWNHWMSVHAMNFYF